MNEQIAQVLSGNEKLEAKGKHHAIEKGMILKVCLRSKYSMSKSESRKAQRSNNMTLNDGNIMLLTSVHSVNSLQEIRLSHANNAHNSLTTWYILIKFC